MRSFSATSIYCDRFTKLNCTPCVETVGGLFTCSNYCALARVTRSTPASAFSYRASTNKSDERRFK